VKIEADIHFWCIGKRLGNTWIEESDFFEYVRDGEGHLKVDANLRLLNMSNVFAAGDITDIQVSFIHHNMLWLFFLTIDMTTLFTFVKRSIEASYDIPNLPLLLE
jgi:hypothetical protein